MGLNLRLLKGLDADEQKNLKASFNSAALFRKQVNSILEEDNASLLSSIKNDSVLTSPNWALVHQDRIAQMKANDRLIKLIAYKK